MDQLAVALIAAAVGAVFAFALPAARESWQDRKRSAAVRRLLWVEVEKQPGDR